MTRMRVSMVGATRLVVAVVAIALAGWFMTDTASLAATRLRETALPEGEQMDTSSYVRVVVPQGSSGEAIANLLVDHGVLSDGQRFRTLLATTGAASELQAGCYELHRRTPALEAIRRMREGITTGRTLVVPEGLRPEEVAERGVAAGIGTTADWTAALKKVDDEPGPVGRTPGTSLVGYLFPAAYGLECDTTPESLVRAMVRTFSERAGTALRDAQRVGLTPHEVVTLASIVEREAVQKGERATIASVYLNRLDDDIGLQADPTVQFAVATPESVAKNGWWKKELTVTDLASRSPYNTYVHVGLPPGPIAAPGLDAILATVRPEQTDYLYFVAKGDGSHVFARTFAEHSRNVAAYQRGQ